MVVWLYSLTSSLCSIKEPGIQIPIRWLFWSASLPSPQSAHSLIKVSSFSIPHLLDSLAYCSANKVSLDSVIFPYLRSICILIHFVRWRDQLIYIRIWIYLSKLFPTIAKYIPKKGRHLVPKFTGNQPWIFIGRTVGEAPILWPPAAKSRVTGKDPDAGKAWGQERMTEDEMVEWHHWLDGHECEHTLGDGEGQGSLTCCSPWGPKESDMT